MRLPYWLAALGTLRIEVRLSNRRGIPRRRRSAVGHAPACFELLEDRTLLTVYVVNTTADTIDAGDGLVSLREAVTAANANAASGNAAAGSADGDVIQISLGDAPQTIKLNPALGQLEINDDLIIDASGNAATVTVSGENATRIFHINAAAGPGTERDVEFRSFVVTGGNGLGRGGPGGGAVLVEHGSDLTLRIVSVTNSSSVTSGGAIYNAGGLSLVASQILGNTAAGDADSQGGGGIFNAGGNLQIEGNSLIDQNRATGTAGSGGGILTVAGRLLVTGSGVFHNAAARAGGGIAARSANGADGVLAYDVQLSGVTLSFNIAGPNSTSAVPNQGDGGGYHGTGPGSVLFNGGSVVANIAAHQGGGLWNSAGGGMTVTGVRVRANVASRGFDDGTTVTAGGGLYNAGLLTASNVQIDHNLAASFAALRLGLGGGIANAAGGTVRLVSGVVSNNGAGRGGAIHSVGAVETTSVETRNVLIESNTALQSGGGIANGGRLFLSGSTVNGNTVSSADYGFNGGAGILNEGGTASVTGSLIRFNHAYGVQSRGGGVFNTAGGRLEMTNSTVFFNSATAVGGGIADSGGTYNEQKRDLLLAGVFLLSNFVTGGSSGYGDGGALHCEGFGIVTLFRNVIEDNSAARGGAGVWTASDRVLRMNETTVSSNTAASGEGGGLYLRGASRIATSLIASNTGVWGGGIYTAGAMSLVNSTVGENRSRGYGGGIFVAASAVGTRSVLIGNVTIARNRADFDPNDSWSGPGGGVYVVGGEDVTLHNTIVALNLVGPDPSPARSDFTGTANAASSFNLIGDQTGSSFVLGPKGNLAGSANAPINPLLGPLADNGGPTKMYAPARNSLAVDRGSDVLLSGMDQRFKPRPVDLPDAFNAPGSDGSDIGAVELQA